MERPHGIGIARRGRRAGLSLKLTTRITNESSKWPVLDVEVFGVENLLHVLRNDFGTLGIRDGRHASHNLRDGLVPIDENVAGYWTSTEWVDDACSPHGRSDLYGFRSNSQMSTHDWQVTLLELMQQILHSDRVS